MFAFTIGPDDPGSKGPPPAKDIAIPGEGQFQYNISLEVDGDTEIIRLHICCKLKSSFIKFNQTPVDLGGRWVLGGGGGHTLFSGIRPHADPTFVLF